MELPYTDEFNRQGTAYLVNDQVVEPLQCIDSDSDSMSTCSSRSASTITSSEVSDFYQERYGRVFPIDENLPVVLPIDGHEHERLSARHRFLQLLVGSNYFGPFREVMERTPRPRVLDIRTQEGTWVYEVATEFPHAEFISVDVVPMIPHGPRPNVTFEVYDVYAGLAEPDDSFDAIHARFCLDAVSTRVYSSHPQAHISQIKNYDMLLREFHRVLRPGGLLMIGEMGSEVYEAWDTDQPATASSPHIHHGLKILREAVNAQGVMLHVLPLIPKWLEPGSTLWDSAVTPQISPNGQQRRKQGFCGIVEVVAHIPNGAWSSDPVLRLVGALAQGVWKETWLSVVPLLLHHNVSPDDVRQILDGAIRELCDPEIRTVWKYKMIHCFKI
ncbi:hypothetical protein FRC10_011422 [Ceratobasidium sp. 414]|nr:hypothetical protein FRC10_011422 [Ceratobasidium sp. 414]